MPIEIYYAPTKRAEDITLESLAQHFGAAGLPCKVEPDSEDTRWLVFEPHESTIYASVKDGLVVLATLNFSPKDDESVAATVERVMESVGFSADEDADYK